jgi:endonuclease/exonuclease/phosphatase family metal-dependent hydrolase
MPWQVPDKMDKQLTILTFNTQGMAIHLSKDKKLEMLNHINSLDADIVCLQEVLVHKDENRFTLSMLREAMDQYPYTYYDFKVYNSQLQFGNVVFSRYL